MHKQTQKKLSEWQGEEVDKRMTRHNYPGSPIAGPGILKKYQELIKRSLKGKKNVRVLILGSTPETREMILKMGYELYTIDISQNLIDKISQLVRADKKREKIIIADWLTMPLPEDYFDLIIGDGVFNNVTFKNFNRFAANMVKVAKKEAWVIFREAVINPKRPLKSIKQIVRAHRKNKYHWFDLFFDIMLYAAEKSRWYKKESVENSLGKMFKEIDKYYQQGIINRQELEDLNNIRSKITHSFPPIPVFEKFLSKYFELYPVRQAADFRFSQDSMIFFYGQVKK